MTGILDQRGYQVDSALNYRTALKLARGNTYDLLISDIELPDGTGLDIMRELRRWHPTPGIAVSGFGSADDVAQSLESGFALHLVKPIDVRALAAAIASVTAKHAVKAPPRGCSRESSSQLAPYDHPSRGEALAV
jgi:DNA-binding response OmpR family regulator